MTARAPSAPAVPLIRIGLGLLDLIAPHRVGAAELGHRPDGISLGALRVLGLRQVVQGALGLRFRSPRARTIGGVVDLLHAGSMLVLAALDRPRTRGALVQASLATGLGISGLVRRSTR